MQKESLKKLGFMRLSEFRNHLFVIIRRKEDIWLVKTNKSEQERKDDGNGKFI